jgi:hypothetical protein
MVLIQDQKSLCSMTATLTRHSIAREALVSGGKTNPVAAINNGARLFMFVPINIKQFANVMHVNPV